jgi:hypothetical protein
MRRFYSELIARNAELHQAVATGCQAQPEKDLGQS